MIKIHRNSDFCGLVLNIFVHNIFELNWLLLNIIVISIWFVFSCQLNLTVVESQVLRKSFAYTFLPKMSSLALFCKQKHRNFLLFSLKELQISPRDWETCALSGSLPEIAGELKYVTYLHETDLEGKLIITNHRWYVIRAIELKVYNLTIKLSV